MSNETAGRDSTGSRNPGTKLQPVRQPDPDMIRSQITRKSRKEGREREADAFAKGPIRVTARRVLANHHIPKHCFIPPGGSCCRSSAWTSCSAIHVRPSFTIAVVVFFGKPPSTSCSSFAGRYLLFRVETGHESLGKDLKLKSRPPCYRYPLAPCSPASAA